VHGASVPPRSAHRRQMSRLSAARPFDVIDMEISYYAEAIEACE
jgi:hypothetical protein